MFRVLAVAGIVVAVLVPVGLGAVVGFGGGGQPAETPTPPPSPTPPATPTPAVTERVVTKTVVRTVTVTPTPTPTPEPDRTVRATRSVPNAQYPLGLETLALNVSDHPEYNDTNATRQIRIALDYYDDNYADEVRVERDLPDADLAAWNESDIRVRFAETAGNATLWYVRDSAANASSRHALLIIDPDVPRDRIGYHAALKLSWALYNGPPPDDIRERGATDWWIDYTD